MYVLIMCMYKALSEQKRACVKKWGPQILRVKVIVQRQQ